MTYDAVSVVIPTCNRSAVLRLAVQGYLRQSRPDLICELLIIDDGSSDDTASVVTELAGPASFSIRYLRQSNQGPAAARNRGIREAQSEVVLFSDDDIIPSADLVNQHLEWQNRYPAPSCAVLGQVTWDADLKPTPFMYWLGSDGPLFAYGHFNGRTELDDYRYFYSCNLSVKRRFLQERGLFDESFKIAAYEDTELGYRLKKQGMRLLYNPGALAYHHQRISFAEACRRLQKSSSAYRIFCATECGAAYRAESRQWRSRRGWKPWLRRRMPSMTPILSLLGRAFDSYISFPTPVYRAVYQAFSDGDRWKAEDEASAFASRRAE